ncbi:HAMP domain-containing protein [Leptospira perolatii]|uniref:HAMP domain-containing protein n=1 Tax=Leptospira perolatii TaxID=2023191 RepID=A0A2M9ZII5_9LEPT|nr:tetratricopeptide repeat protein [Leptospira perolatii]PJZ68333.1 HAMP domain-containing protein [Leptospira perolatii]PJZ71821.1 HAMP domain-containing protein [Leptospira perolatii]
MIVLTFASISYLTGAILTGLCSYFLLFRRDKLETTLQLGWIFLFCSILQISFLLGTSLYYQTSFLHRWIALPCVFLICTHLLNYFYLLHPQASPRFSRILIGSGYAFSFGILIFHIVRTLGGNSTYSFSGSVFEIIQHTDEKLIAWILILYLSGILIFGGIRAFQAYRIDLKLLALSIWVPFLLLLGTTIAFHAKEIAFPIERAFALSFWNPILLTALFLTWLVHLRASGEAFTLRTPLLLGILLLLLFVFQGSSWLFLQPGLDSFRDTIKERQKAEDLPKNSYTVTVQDSPGFPAGTFGESDLSLFSETRKDLILSFLWDKPKEISQEYPAYEKAAEDLNKVAKNSKEFEEKLLSLSKELEPYRRKVEHLREKGFKESVILLLNPEGHKKILSIYLQVLSGKVRNSPAEGDSLKILVLDQMREIVPDGEPRFRRIIGTQAEYYYSIIQKSPGKTSAKEIGIPYSDYLKFQTGLLLKPLIAFLLCLILFGIGSYWFLSYLVFLPLDRLYSGLELVTEGDLNRELGAEAWDEIGSIADQFNRMIQAMRNSMDNLLSGTNENPNKSEGAVSSMTRAKNDFSASISELPDRQYSLQELFQQVKATSSPDQLKAILMQLESMPGGSNRSKLILKTALKLKDYRRALHSVETLLEFGKSDPELLFLSSYCHKKIGEYEKAIELAEQTQEISPQHSQNRLHLAELYYLSGNLEKATQLATKIRMEEGPSPTLSKLLNAIEKKSG